MCYSIPGKVLEVNDALVTLDYFGEKRKARNELFQISCGEYAYAQGGFIIQKIPGVQAEAILDSWQELFFKLKEIDKRLARDSGTRYQKANQIRQKYHGNSCCVHGIIEFSNYCRNECLYCGIQHTNLSLKRYRMEAAEIIDAAVYAVKKLGFKALVLQSGEDGYYDEDTLIAVVEGIMRQSPCLLTLSIGERSPDTFEALYRKGLRGVLLRFETSNPQIYATMKPGHSLNQRLELLVTLRKMGYLIMTGFLIGLPGWRKEDIIKDISLTAELGAEMFSFGPFIPCPDTPLAGEGHVSLETALEVIAEARIRNPEAKILVTTALETLDKKNALQLGLMAGANSIMLNATPSRYQQLYSIYPFRAGTDTTIESRIEFVVNLLQSLGRAPTDLGVS
ncbi:MAG: radical SAM protein [Candidatus Omnitrophota bacterium]